MLDVFVTSVQFVDIRLDLVRHEAFFVQPVRLIVVARVGMPRCEGLPGGPCPDRKHDNTVKIGEGDLMLCRSCDATRFRQFCESKQSAASDCASVTAVSANARQSRNRTGTKVSTKSGSVTSDVPVGLSNNDDIVAADTFSEPVIPNVTTQCQVKAHHIIVNEMLSYVNFYRDNSSYDCIRKVVLGFYSAAEISDAKKLLFENFKEQLSDCPMPDRRNSSSRPAHEAEVDDILSIFEVLDNMNMIQDEYYLFAATNHERLPKYGPEEVNICTVVDKQVQLDMKMANLTTKFGEVSSGNQRSDSVLTDAMTRVEASVLESTKTLLDQITQLQAMCNSVPGTGQVQAREQRPSSVVYTRQAHHDRSRNVIINGIEEVRDDSTWRAQVDEALKTAAGREVSVNDVFRLGKYSINRTRPLLVKLHSAWDRRIILNGARKLAGVERFARIFISPDDPLEVRRKKTLDRLKRTATKQNKIVTVINGVINIDGKDVFSVDSGFLVSSNGNSG